MIILKKRACKSLLQEAIQFLLHNCSFSIGNIIMIQVIGIPMGSDKLLDILYKDIDFVFKGGTRDYIVINKHGCASWSS